jgi:hypothetical protein
VFKIKFVHPNYSFHVSYAFCFYVCTNFPYDDRFLRKPFKFVQSCKCRLLNGCELKLNYLDKLFSAKFVQNLVYHFEEETLGQIDRIPSYNFISCNLCIDGMKVYCHTNGRDPIFFIISFIFTSKLCIIFRFVLLKTGN